MARYSIHPADNKGHYHDVKVYKNRSRTLAQTKEEKRLKKLRKKRRKGG